MSRNSEKAQSMLFRFREQQAAEMGIVDLGRTRRPRNVSLASTVQECEKWRGQVARDISRKITRINEPSLSEDQIRDTNDEINKMMREKYAWEIRIKDLGGPNYLRFGNIRPVDEDGKPLPSIKGYQYFGRARELPDVKELFEAEAARQRAPQIPKSHAPRDLPASYYGFGDEDPAMLEEELEYSSQWSRTAKAEQDEPLDPTSDELLMDVAAPSVQEVEQYLVDRRKQRLEQLYLE